jgi:hypothetical protein
MIEKRKRRVLSVAPVAWGVVAFLLPFSVTLGAVPITLEVQAVNGLPGLAHSALLHFLVAHMTEAGLAGWSFEPAETDNAAPNRVEWTFKFGPDAAGDVRSFMRAPATKRFDVPRPVTIEVRLYLNGEYQTLVERQAMIQRGPNDPELAAAVANATAGLLGPSGAYGAIDLGQQRPSPGAR